MEALPSPGESGPRRGGCPEGLVFPRGHVGVLDQAPHLVLLEEAPRLPCLRALPAPTREDFEHEWGRTCNVIPMKGTKVLTRIVQHSTANYTWTSDAER